MNPKTAAKWVEAYIWAQQTRGIPPILAKEAAKRAGVALRKAKPFKASVRVPRGLKPKAKLTPIPKLKKELDRVFSIWIRERDANDYGNGRCVTCGRSGHLSMMDCGHFQSRGFYATRWHEWNCALQCKLCNAFRGGEQVKFAAAIDARYGEGKAKELERISRIPFKLNRDWLQKQIDKYSAKPTVTLTLPHQPKDTK